MIVSLFSRFRFVISMYCESTIFLPCKCVTSETKESFVSRTNAPLVGTLISIYDVSESIAKRRGLFNQGPVATQTFWKRESFYTRKRFQHTHRTAWTPTWPPFHCFRTDQYGGRRHVKALHKSVRFLEFVLSWALVGSCGFKGYKFYKNDTKCIVKVYISHMIIYRISQLYLQNEYTYTKRCNKQGNLT